MSSSPNQKEGKETTEQANSMINSRSSDVTSHTSIHIPLETVSHVANPGWKRGLLNVALPVVPHLVQGRAWALVSSYPPLPQVDPDLVHVNRMRNC